jgi:hypothetical protein
LSGASFCGTCFMQTRIFIIGVFLFNSLDATGGRCVSAPGITRETSRRNLQV